MLVTKAKWVAKYNQMPQTDLKTNIAPYLRIPTSKLPSKISTMGRIRVDFSRIWIPVLINFDLMKFILYFFLSTKKW